MNTLPLEVIEYIAKFDNKTWYHFVQVYRFLYEKTLNSNYVNDLKRKFLLYSTITNKRDVNATYKYNNRFHTLKTNDQSYVTVYYLPNGQLHTCNNPCIAYCGNEILYIWFKDNNIHRDYDLPAVIYYGKIQPVPEFYILGNINRYFRDPFDPVNQDEYNDDELVIRHNPHQNEKRILKMWYHNGRRYAYQILKPV